MTARIFNILMHKKGAHVLSFASFNLLVFPLQLFLLLNF
jgi:hypothetical protein